MPISRPIPRRCHLRWTGCRTRQIKCRSTRPTGYLAIVVMELLHQQVRGGWGFLSKEVVERKTAAKTERPLGGRGVFAFVSIGKRRQTGLIRMSSWPVETAPQKLRGPFILQAQVSRARGSPAALLSD